MCLSSTLAWEVTIDDIIFVLDTHNVKYTKEYAEELLDEFFWGQNSYQVEKAVLAYTDFQDQCNAANCEIENILMEELRIQGSKKFIG